MPLPESVNEKVLRRIFRDLERLQWNGLTDEQKTKQYNAWVDDPEVGGILAQFNNDPRHWIKDGPVKEWPRALMGLRPYAKYLPVKGGQIEQVIELSLGDAWIADLDSIKIKPLRVVARHQSNKAESVVVTWAPAKDFKHLVWAALNEEAKGDHREWILVVRGTFENPTPAEVQAHHIRVAERCGLRVEHIQVG